MLMEESECPLTRPHRAGCAITCAPIAVEAVTRVVAIDLRLGVSLRNAIHFARRNMIVQFAKVKHHWYLRLLIHILRNPAAVVADGCMNWQARRTEPRQRATQTVAHYANLLYIAKASLALYRCRNIIHARLDIETLQKAHRPLHVLTVTAQIDMPLDPVKQRGRDHHKSIVARKPVCHRADVRIHTEDLLHNDQSAPRRHSRLHHVGVQDMTILRPKLHYLAHRASPPTPEMQSACVGNLALVCGVKRPSVHATAPKRLICTLHPARHQ